MEDTLFPLEIAEDVTGLLYIGQLTKTVHWGGHEFLLRTLRAAEELAIGLVTKEHNDTPYLGRAIAAATVGAALETLDGMPFVVQLGPDQHVSVEQKYRYVATKWFWPTIEKLYTEYLDLQQRQFAAYEALEGKSERNRPNSSPDAGSLNDRANSEAS